MLSGPAFGTLCVVELRVKLRPFDSQFQYQLSLHLTVLTPQTPDSAVSIAFRDFAG